MFIFRRRDFRIIRPEVAIAEMGDLGRIESADHPGGDRCSVLVKFRFRDRNRDPVKVSERTKNQLADCWLAYISDTFAVL